MSSGLLIYLCFAAAAFLMMGLLFALTTGISIWILCKTFGWNLPWNRKLDYQVDKTMLVSSAKESNVP
jgi:uncharacterized membrane protein